MKETQEIYQKAIKFAAEKHGNQTIPGSNANYLLHLSNVAMEVLMAFHQKPDFDLGFAIQIALLHDTIEDTEATFDEIKSAFDQKTAQAVVALTKNKELEPKEIRMIDCLKRINKQPKEAAIVKLADRITNLQTPPKHWNNEKILKYYQEAKLISKSLKGKNEYLNMRLDAKIVLYKKNIVLHKSLFFFDSILILFLYLRKIAPFFSSVTKL